MNETDYFEMEEELFDWEPLDEEEEQFFQLKEDALRCLYEELYNGDLPLNEEAVYDALRFLMYKEQMNWIWKEFSDLTPGCIEVKRKEENK